MRIAFVCCLALSVLGCGASKGTQKGTDDQLKALSTTSGSSPAPLPAAANEKMEKITPGGKGAPAGQGPGKGFVPPTGPGGGPG